MHCQWSDTLKTRMKQLLMHDLIQHIRVQCKRACCYAVQYGSSCSPMIILHVTQGGSIVRRDFWNPVGTMAREPPCTHRASLLPVRCMGLHSHRSECQCWPLFTSYKGPPEHQNWPEEKWKKVAWPDESGALLHRLDIWMHARHLPGEEIPPGGIMGRRQVDRGSVNLWAMFC